MSAPPGTAVSSTASERREALWTRYARFLSRPPECVLEWNDPESEARGWLVQNSLRGGAAGGGTRMRGGLDREEVVYLAKVMELKFAVSGPPIGGAKAGIDFDPRDPRKADVLRRWFEHIRPVLQERFGTAGDLNVDAGREVAPLAREVGLRHPQEGILRGHYGLSGADLERRLEAMSTGLHRAVAGRLGLPGSELRVGDLVTGYGVARATLRLLERGGRRPEDVRVLVEGFGSVGGAAALYLARAGARIVGVVDAEGGRVAEDGFEVAVLEDLLLRREGGLLPRDLPDGRMREEARRFREMDADVFVCAAASGTLDEDVLGDLADRGVDTLVSGANRPFAAARPGDVTVERQADERFAVLADVISNCGAARAFSHQMSHDEAAPAEELFEAVEATVVGAVDEVVNRAGTADRHLLSSALEMTLERVAGGGGARPRGGGMPGPDGTETPEGVA